MASAMWRCLACGGAAEDEQSLLDHQEWCLGDALENTLLLSEVAERHKGELTHEALVAAARKRGGPVKSRPPRE